MPFTVLVCPHVTALAKGYQIIGGTIHLVVVDVMPSQASTRSPAVWILALKAISFKDHGSEFSILEISSVWIGGYSTLPIPMISTLPFRAHFLPSFLGMLVPEKVLIPQHSLVENFLNLARYFLPIHRVILTAHALALSFPELFSPGLADPGAMGGTECSPNQGLTCLRPARRRPLGSEASLVPEEHFTAGTSATTYTPVDD